MTTLHSSESGLPMSFRNFLVPGLLLPIILINAIGFVLPIMQLAIMSFRVPLATGGLGEGYTAGNWSDFVADTYYLRLIWSTVWMSAVVTVAALVCSYPIAWFIHNATGLVKSVVLVLVVTPLLTSAVVRSYGWVTVLGDQGLIATILNTIPGVTAPRLMYNMTGVIIGLTEIQMPYVILAILVGLGKVDPYFREAARTLGATPAQTFWRVVLPISMPGVALGCLLSFVHSVSAFVTPRVLGGGRVNVLATEIYEQSTTLLNWPIAGLISVVVLILFSIALGFYSRAISRLTF